jgi:hypothetical protein
LRIVVLKQDGRQRLPHVPLQSFFDWLLSVNLRGSISLRKYWRFPSNVRTAA